MDMVDRLETVTSRRVGHTVPSPRLAGTLVLHNESIIYFRHHVDRDSLIEVKKNQPNGRVLYGAATQGTRSFAHTFKEPEKGATGYNPGHSEWKQGSSQLF